MKFLVYWDQPDEAELLRLYLAVDGDEVTLCRDLETLRQAVGRVGEPRPALAGVEERPQPVGAAPSSDAAEPYDGVLMAIDSPDYDQTFAAFEAVASAQPGVPVLAACPPDDVYRVARFLTAGVRSYVIRDPAGDFLFLVRSLLESVVEAVRAERERAVAERLREEVESVRQLQQSIIPNDLIAPAGYEIVGRYEASQIRVLGGQPVTLAGGDYYDAFVLPDDRVVLLVGDASGHGMKACLSILTMHTLIRMIREGGHADTSAFVGAINRQICRETPVGDDGGFITLLYAILDPATHTVEWTSAGHPMPILQQTESDEIDDVAGYDAAGLPLGVVDDAEYTAHRTSLPCGSRLLLYTDGLPEAHARDQSSHCEFGKDGMMEALRRSGGQSLAETMQALFRKSEAFTEGAGRHDDTSVLLVERM